MKRLHATALACSSLILSGCLMLTPSPREPEFQPVRGEDARIQAWLERLSREGAAHRSLRAVGKLQISSEQGSGRVKEVILAERPARLRIESLGLLGNTLSLLVTDGERFSVFDGRTLEGGVVWPGVLDERLGLQLEPSEAVDVLLGSALRAEWPPQSILGRAEEREVRLSDQRLRLGPEGVLLGLESLSPDGKVRWRADYSQWRDLPGGRYPFEVALFFPASNLRAELVFSRVELNPELEASLFSVQPRGAR